MSRAAWAAVALAAIIAAGAGGVWLVRPDLLQRHSIGAEAPAAPGGTRALYYRDPDGKPAYSLEPAKTSDGRAYIAVKPGEEKLSFETGEEPAPPASGKIKFYRNPMGLADYSPVPKKELHGDGLHPRLRR